MKVPAMPGLAVGAVIIIGILAAASAARGEQPSFFPIDSGKLVLPMMCMASQRLSWTEGISQTIGGFSKGADVRIVYTDGAVGGGHLGQVVCYIGECRGNYVAVVVEGLEPGRRAVALFDARGPLGPLPALSPWQKTETPGACSGLPPQGSDPGGFGFDPIAPVCRTYRAASEEPIAPPIQIAGHGWMQENDWPIYRFYSRTIGDGTAGQWSELDVSTGAIEPSFVFRDDRGAPRILWTQREGIGGPARITFKEMVVSEDGSQRWLSSYQAGGQPCD